jgi:hypothetical protein
MNLICLPAVATACIIGPAPWIRTLVTCSTATQRKAACSFASWSQSGCATAHAAAALAAAAACPAPQSRRSISSWLSSLQRRAAPGADTPAPPQYPARPARLTVGGRFDWADPFHWIRAAGHQQDEVDGLLQQEARHYGLYSKAWAGIKTRLLAEMRRHLVG